MWTNREKRSVSNGRVRVGELEKAMNIEFLRFCKEGERVKIERIDRISIKNFFCI